MVGNDIIDLELARQQSDWQRKGFLHKVFTQEEKSLIHSSDDPFWTVWRMWSMKESAYKLFIQTGCDRFFNPFRLSCEFHSQEEGTVTIGKAQIYTRSKYHSRFIFTSALSNYTEETEHHVFRLSKSDISLQSKQTHQQLLECIARKCNLQLHKLNIIKTGQNVPEVFCGKQRLNISVSLTHHGYYGAYSLCER